MDLSIGYHRAALMFAISAVLGVAVIILSAASNLMPSVIGIVLGLVFAFGLLRQWRWLAYFAFLVAMMVAIWGFGNAMVEFGLLQISFFGITLANLMAALMLFGVLWRNKS